MGQKVLGDPARGSPMALGEQGYVSSQEGWHPVGNGCKVLNSCKLGISHVVGGPHSPWAKPGRRLGIEPPSLLGHVCSLPW